VSMMTKLLSFTLSTGSLNQTLMGAVTMTSVLLAAGITASIAGAPSIPLPRLVPSNTARILTLSFVIIDTVTGTKVPATIMTGIESGHMQAVLTPKWNLYYARKYEMRLVNSITDSFNNANGSRMNLPSYSSFFTTKVPKAYDLATNQQFSGGRDIALYTFTDNDGESKTYAYITASTGGWRVVNVTDPTKPVVIHTASPTCSPQGEECHHTPLEFDFRSIAIDQDKRTMAITENILFADGNQYGYIRFYDLASNPANPPIVGREKLAEAMSGIPGRIALMDDKAYVATINAGLQVVDIVAAKDYQATRQSTDSSTIVGTYDSIGEGYGQPDDIAVYSASRALLTTTSGNLLTLDVSLPFPQFMAKYQDNNNHVLRVGVAAEYTYLDPYGNQQVDDIAVVGTREGRVLTINLADPYNPKYMATARNKDGQELITSVREISVNRDSRLAFVTTINSVQVIDIKDPNNPRLLTDIVSLPDPSGAIDQYGNPVLQPLGNNPAIVEKGGWVYLASQSKGVRIIDLDPPIINVTPEKIFILLNNDSKTSKEYTLTYGIILEPGADNTFDNPRVMLFKNGVKIREWTDVQPGKVMTLIAQDTPLDINSIYHAQVLVYDKKQGVDIPSAKVPIVIGKFEISAEDGRYRGLKGAATDGTAKLTLELKISSNYKEFVPHFSLEDPVLGMNTYDTDRNSTGLMSYQGGWASAIVPAYDAQSQSFKAIYRVPPTYVRFGTNMEATDKLGAERSVNLNLRVTDIKPEIKLRRPPVVLVHGLWAKPDSWDTFEPELDKYDQYQIERADYGTTNAEAIATNFGKVKDKIKKTIEAAIGDGFYAEKSNVIGHSMGGLLTREYCRMNRSECEEKINKFVSIDTPHKGSELADYVSKVNNSSKLLPCYLLLGKVEEEGNTIWADNTKTKIAGALEDLQVGSEAINKLHTISMPFEWTAVAGVAEDGVRAYDEGIFKLWKGLTYLCLKVPDSSFGLLTAMFSSANDRIVSLSSQLDNQPYSFIIRNVDHSSVLKESRTVEKIRDIIER